MKYFKTNMEDGNISFESVNKPHPFKMHGINFFASKDKSGWNITEISTGYQLLNKRYKNKKEAIESVEQLVSEVGIDKVRTVIKAAYERYKAEIDRYTSGVSQKVTNVVEI